MGPFCWQGLDGGGPCKLLSLKQRALKDREGNEGLEPPLWVPGLTDIIAQRFWLSKLQAPAAEELGRCARTPLLLDGKEMAKVRTWLRA